VLAGISSAADWPADMVEYDPRVRKRASKVSEFGDLRMVEPGVE
jgi:hypothetical protein